MKRILKLAALAVLGMMTASCSKNAAPEEGVPVSISVQAPEIGTKSISDGKSVNQVRCIVFRDGKLIQHSDVTKVIPMVGGTATYTTRLISGQTYKIVFWAEVKDNAYYSVDYQNATVTVTYGAGNEEKRDAFYNVIEYTVTDGQAAQTVTLKRPFAQLNYGLSAADKALADAVSPIAKASVKLDDVVYTKLNLFDGSVSAPLSSVTFTSAPILTEPLTVKAEGASAPVEYTYLSMNYILVNQDVVPNTTLTLYGADDAIVATVPVSQVPLKRNYRTNIVGNLISSPATINIVVDPAYEVPENNISK